VLRLLIIAQETRPLTGLCAGLVQNGLACSITSYSEGAMEEVAHQSPDLVLVEMDGPSPDSRTGEFISRMKRETSLPVVALVARETLDGLDGHLEADDFLISPYNARELVLRINRLHCRNGNTESNELVKCDGLLIDLARCEVTVEDKIVELTFKEYELLKVLAGNRGRVYTRDVLLNMIWGYDYYGGDRTVDVHVRRLRSKIEDPKHSFIETVRNIGYRFRKKV
jgi:DNA-binding response OmpR family regulator